MNRLLPVFRSLVIFAASLLPVMAEEAGHGEPDLTFSKWIHFGLLFALLVYGWVKAVAPRLRLHAAKILSDIEDARRTQSESQAKVAAIQGRLGNLETEIASFRRESRELIASEGERLRQETRDLIARLSARTDQEIASLTRHTKAGLRAEATRLAVSMAAAQLRTGLNREEHGRLLTGFAADLDAGGRN